jgi:Holliday junction resolvase-like predicted endonuclease
MADEQIPPGFEFLANRFDKSVGELRGELRASVGELRGELRAMAEQNERRWEQNERRWEQNERRWEQAEQRFEAIETSLRDMSEQLVMHSRALNTLLQRRPDDEEWREAIERRLEALEQQR